MFGPHTRRALLLLAALVVAVVWLDSITGKSAIEVGQELGEVRAELVDGSGFRLADHRGEVVVLNFWATWCGPCRREAPALSRLHHQGVRVLGLAVDALPLSTIAQKARGIGIDYPIGQGAPGLTDRLSIQTVPTTCVVGRDGKVAMVEHGVISYDELRDAVAAADKRQNP
jgi:thiol-disulfide isomerase/thioredoxin